MDTYLDDRLRRKLIERRGRLHAFDRLTPRSCAVVIVDAVAAFLDALPDHYVLIEKINCLTQIARAQGVTIAWIKPTPPSTWPNAGTARALLGMEQVNRHERDMRNGGPGASIHPGLTVTDQDWILHKHGHSAFFPGNCELPDRLRANGIDTVLLAGVLTDICVAASAKDAHESSFRVLIGADAVAANEPELHRYALRSLARVYADVRPVEDMAALLTCSSDP